MELSQLPAVNASLNGLSAFFLILGWKSIKQGNKTAHRNFMLCALGSSFLFLGTYVTYHLLVHGITRFQREGIMKAIYLFILLTHTPLAMVIVPASLAALFFAIKGNLKRHKEITRWLLPVWLYVSITGVLIYVMLYTLKGRGY